jgi:uncharacterized protein
MPDKVVHFELPADNLERAKKFYKDTFGWSINQPPGEGYALVSTVATDSKGRPKEPGAINGGMLKRQEPIRQLVVTINVASIEEAGKRIEKAGGKLVRKKQPVGPVGFAAYFQDTEGNVLGLWEDATAPGSRA